MVESVPAIVRSSSPRQDAKDLLKKHELLASTDMSPVAGTIEVNVPTSVLWETFTHANWWPRWNKCFFWAHNCDLVLGKKLIWAFQPIRPWYLYKMPATANIVELEKERKVTWEVTVLPGFYARHTYHMEDIGDGRTRFGSWEQAMGGQIKLAPFRKFWTGHFTFVKDRSLEGAQTLEKIYGRDGKITGDALKGRRTWKSWVGMLLLLLALIGGAVGLWFYVSYLRPEQIELAPGVSAVLAGGSNSLIVEDGGEMLVVDTKFPPASGWLRKRLTGDDHRRSGTPKVIVNTHYHYDHTQGNPDYPGVKIYAQRSVPDLLRKYNGDWWQDHPAGMPNELVDGETKVRVGTQEVVLVHPGSPAHTRGDLWVYLRRGDREIVATGDLFLNGYYPFMDLSEGGTNIAGLINAVRTMANRYPNAAFLPGHGPVSTAADLNRFADYLQTLNEEVARARAAGQTEDQAAASIDLSKRWNFTRLPSLHGGKFCWATAEWNVRWLYRLQSGTPATPGDCKF